MGKKTISSGEAERLLEKAMKYLAVAEGEKEGKKRIKEMEIIIKMAGGIKNIPEKTRRRVLKILEGD